MGESNSTIKPLCCFADVNSSVAPAAIWRERPAAALDDYLGRRTFAHGPAVLFFRDNASA